MLEPKVPSPGRQGTLSIHLKDERGYLPSTTELECPAYNDIFDKCPWITGDSLCVCRDGSGDVYKILFNNSNVDLSSPNQPFKDYYWFFEYIRTKNKPKQ